MTEQTDRRPLSSLSADELADAVRRVAAGLRVVDPALATASLVEGRNPLTPREQDVLREALVTHDRKTVYRVEDGIPVLLAEEAIATAQVDDFPAR